MFKSGFIGIIGRPNVGKSTLLNVLVGEKIAIATHKPQTTRNRISGILNTDRGQFVFVDTPGIHNAATPLNRQMVATATDTFRNADILCLVIEAGTGLHREDISIIDSLKTFNIPVILAINKTDLVVKSSLLPLIDGIRKKHSFSAIVPLSAINSEGVDILVDEIWNLLPEGQPFFPDDIMTDRSERFIAAEIIREKIILLTHQEIPYVTAVMIESFKEDEVRKIIRIQATIHVEKDSQKGILIGKKGSMLKRIGIKAREELEAFFGMKIYLELFVRVQKDWTRDARMLNEFGYSGKS